MSTKIHACTDALGNAVRLDTPMVIADTSYDSDANRAHCAEKGIAVVIPNRPNRPNRLEPVPLDEAYYRDRNKVERLFGRMKQCRRLATRYEKTVVSFLAFWHIAAALDWLR